LHFLISKLLIFVYYKIYNYFSKSPNDNETRKSAAERNNVESNVLSYTNHRTSKLTDDETKNLRDEIKKEMGVLGLDSRLGVGKFSLHHRVQNGSGAHPASYPMGTRGSFPRGKATGA
jgi:hypothetical protein